MLQVLTSVCRFRASWCRMPCALPAFFLWGCGIFSVARQPSRACEAFVSRA